jgi:predicted CXXCH cytochrome family protein
LTLPRFAIGIVALLLFVGASGPAFAADSPHGDYAPDPGLGKCGMCHRPHEAQTSQGLLFLTEDSTTTVVTQTLFCFKCHGDSGPAESNAKASFETGFPSGHKTEDLAADDQDADLTNTCAGCHDPHSKVAGLPRTEINGQEVTRTADPNSWCLACHTPELDPNWSGLVGDDYYDLLYELSSRDASGYPTTGTFRGVSAYNASAHSTIPASDTVTIQESPLRTASRGEGDCLWCHASHRGVSEYDNLLGEFGPSAPGDPGADVCFGCHDAGEGYGTGHFISSPGSVLAAGSPLPCYECHNAHGSKNGNAMLGQDSLGSNLDPSTPGGQSAFCYTCHLSADGYGWNSYSSPAGMEDWTTLQSQSGITTSVVGIAREDMVALPASVGAHDSSVLEGCTCHGSPHAPNPDGISNGGLACYGCHSTYKENMEYTGSARTGSYHHVLGKAGTPGDTAFASGSYPGAGSDVYCLSCHVDHDKFNSDMAANLRDSLGASPAGSNTDFGGSASPGVCLGCHNVARAKDTTNRKDDGTTFTPAISAADYDASAHQYKVASQFGDSTSFQGDCSKCHSDRQSKTFQTGSITFGLHWDSSRRILAALGRTSVPDPYAEERFCYGCHSAAGDGFKSTAGRDWYGAAGAIMSASSQNIYAQTELTPSSQLFFKPVSEEAVSGNLPTGDQSGDTYQGGTWQARSMSPAASSAAYESYDTATAAIPTGTQNWRRVRFVSPEVAAAVTLPASSWTVSVFARESNGSANAYMRPHIYVWRADNATKVDLVAPATLGAEFATTALPGASRTQTTAAGSAVTLQPGDRIVLDLAIQTVNGSGTYATTYSWGSNAVGSLQAPTSITWNVDPASGHGVGDYIGLHKPSDADETRAYLSANKHVECADCHNPHAAGSTLHSWDGANTNKIGDDSPLLGVWGERAVYPAPQADAANLGTRWVAPSGYVRVGNATYEYEVCFKCHSGANSSLTSWGGSGADAWTNVALEFNIDNASYHPVMGPVKSHTRYTKTTAWMKDPWNKTAANGGLGVQTMTCTDCHGSPLADSQAQGPHGSSIKWILKGTWPTKRADGTGAIGTADMWRLTDSSFSGMLCDRCHNVSTISFRAHTSHTNTNRDNCVYCHVTVPHGSAMYGLLGDGDSTMPARYAYGNDLNNMKMRAYGGNPENGNSCNVGGTGCTQHTGNTGLWNW